MAVREKDHEVTFVLTRHIGIIGKNSTSGWKKELNEVAWNGNPPKYDLRDWDEEHKVMSRGITLNKGEAKNLLKLLQEDIPVQEEATPQ